MVLLELLGVSLFFETFETTHRPFFWAGWEKLQLPLAF